MTITKRVPKKESVDQFINNAPDGDKQRKGVKKGKREQISLTIPPALLDRLDAVANRLALSRAGMINLAIVRAIEQEEKNN
ncbi:MAG: hypothetical protein KDI39_18750 [Pseudomonadales bacterium]|nr:hypothetical protein [Pseudomonadales bacterium]HNH45232.1 hypothetical protein [Agitococcus sp.]HNP02852.1 hypothetical protein [Agitococcus sp.]